MKLLRLLLLPVALLISAAMALHVGMLEFVEAMRDYWRLW